MSNYTDGFQRMVDLALEKDRETLDEAVIALARVEELTREQQITRSALLVAYEQKFGTESCEALMNRAGI